MTENFRDLGVEEARSFQRKMEIQIKLVHIFFRKGIENDVEENNRLMDKWINFGLAAKFASVWNKREVQELVTRDTSDDVIIALIEPMLRERFVEISSEEPVSTGQGLDEE